ncbi:CBS domain-containing protein [Natronocalculus amylovorans]|uniref:CBS domain-containing protein n=1 Tax=Natronocalculus amylovorans TaxID=2917812 RepID=A0AAE3K834_9EURY|nr:CBS domain-containing protein [Natronocalculus amylovorans]MCL9816100.1 CBS domain-containing protein [Natronocalculus amylovorans]NUE01380.1 CBS domain-containing protein [Halorubraceae archaeon YAN]
MNVADAMTPAEKLVTVSLPGTRDDVLTYLQDHGFSSVPVVKDVDGVSVFRGLVSRDDLIENPDEDQLALLMREVPTIGTDATLSEAAALMVREGARRVPVTSGAEQPTLDGIITVTDVIRAIARGNANGEATVGLLATAEVNTTYIETPLPVAEREIYYSNVPYAVVLDDDAEMAGIITEADIVKVARVVEGEDNTGESIAEQDSEWAWEGIKAVGGRYLPTRNVEIPVEPVSEFMTADTVTVSKRRTAKEAAQEMISSDIEQIPLVSGGELVGMVRDIDLLEAV